MAQKPSAPRFGAPAEKCTVCLQSVYPLEKMVVEGRTIHKSCFKCEHCKGQLSLSGFASVNGRVYCKPHYIKLFKESGGKYDVFKKSIAPPPLGAAAPGVSASSPSSLSSSAAASGSVDVMSKPLSPGMSPLAAFSKSTLAPVPSRLALDAHESPKA